jgi:hypothetical protein
MFSISERGLLANLSAEELVSSLQEFMTPVLAHLPETRLRRVGVLVVRGVLAAQCPVLSEMARGGQPEDALNWPLVKRSYCFVAHARSDHRDLLKGLYGIAQRAVAHYPQPYLVIAIDPVNFEKPYTEVLPGVSTVLKSTPPGLKCEKRLTPGYPAITATIVNLPEPVGKFLERFLTGFQGHLVTIGQHANIRHVQGVIQEATEVGLGEPVVEDHRQRFIRMGRDPLLEQGLGDAQLAGIEIAQFRVLLLAALPDTQQVTAPLVGGSFLEQKKCQTPNASYLDQRAAAIMATP